MGKFAAAATKIQLPQMHNWRTTDADEVNRRRQRAQEESFAITNATPEHPIFSTFRVKSASGQTHTVEIRDLQSRHSTCDCGRGQTIERCAQRRKCTFLWSDPCHVSPTGTAVFNVSVYDENGNLIASQRFWQAQPAMIGTMSYLANYEYQGGDTSHDGEWSIDPWGCDTWGIPVIPPFWNSVGGTEWNYQSGGQEGGYAMYSGAMDNWFQLLGPSSGSINSSLPAGENAYGGEWANYTYPQESVRARIMIEPPGNSVAGQQALYRVRTQVINKDTAAQIPAAQIQITGSLAPAIDVTNADGSVWSEALVSGPSGQPIEVTPTDTGRNITFQNTTAQQVQLKLYANGVDLSLAKPEFCVGQQVVLSNSFDPPLPAGAQVTNQWIVSGDYVNTNFQPVYPGASTDYTLSTSLLTNNPTSLWWYGGGDNTYLWCKCGVMLGGGRTIAIMMNGTVSVFRPRVQFPFLAIQPFIPMLDGGVLKLGVDSGELGAPNFSALIASSAAFPGAANWVQLIMRSGAPNFTTTQGQYWLDNDPFYNTHGLGGPNQDTAVDPTGGIAFDDCPAIGVLRAPMEGTSVDDQFETYLVFKPDPQNTSIWVTLGVVKWGWSASEITSIYLTETLTSSFVYPLTYTDTIAFPNWINVLHNK